MWIPDTLHVTALIQRQLLAYEDDFDSRSGTGNVHHDDQFFTNSAMDSTWLVWGNISMTPAASSR
jgi:hypothetical protein